MLRQGILEGSTKELPICLRVVYRRLFQEDLKDRDLKRRSDPPCVAGLLRRCESQEDDGT